MWTIRIYKPLTARYSYMQARLRVPKLKRGSLHAFLLRKLRAQSPQGLGLLPRGKHSSYGWSNPHYAKIQRLIPTVIEPDSFLYRSLIYDMEWYLMGPDPSPSTHGNPTMLESSSRIEMVSHPLQKRLLLPAGRSNQGKNAVKIWRNAIWNKEADRTKGNIRIEAHHEVWRDSYNIGSAPVYHRSENLSQSWAKQRVVNWNMSFRKTLQSQTTSVSSVNCIQS